MNERNISMDSTHSVPCLSMHGNSPPNPSDWEALEERLFALTDEIERDEGVPVEYAYHLAQLRLGMICELPSADVVPPSESPDDLILLPF